MNAKFLDPSEIIQMESTLRDTSYITFGGYEGAERQMMFITDEKNIDFEKYISIIKITSNKKIDHRSVLREFAWTWN